MNDILKEALKDIPTIKSDLLISAYESIDLDELNKTVERLNKIPNYDDLMKENQKLQSNWNSLREWLEERIEHWKNEEKKWIEQGFMKFGGEANNKIILKGLLDKMNELEGKDKE